MSVSWYLNRLRTMSLPEIGFRLRQFSQKEIEKRRWVGHFPGVSLISPPKSILDIDTILFKDDGNLLNVFGIDVDFSRLTGNDWHLDIYTQKHFPRTFSKSIDIRSDRHGSAKHVWEINRLQFLPRIAMKYRITGNEACLRLFQSLNESWIAENPYLTGVNWYSNIEVNLRLITWYLCWEILDVNKCMTIDAAFRKFVNEKWLPEIYLHCKYSYQNPSKFSSANNHLISEAAGLFIASTFWKFAESEKWQKYAKKLLEQEMARQHSPNGINKEEAAEYIQFITDFFLLAYIVAKNAGSPLSQSYRDRLKAIFYYIYHLMDKNGNLPFYGDGDDGRTFMLESGAPFNNFKSLLTSAAIIFENPQFKAKSNGFDNKNAILFGREGRDIFHSLDMPVPAQQSQFFADEGHFIFKKNGDSGEIQLHFNAAPLGFLSIAAHGHADALSFNMSVDGNWFFIDPGTFCYHSDKEWRQYFISTLAHNTICVDGQNQAVNGGPTLWTEHYESKVLHVEKNGRLDIVKATHNGYQKSGVSHIREIRFDKVSQKITILDNLNIYDGQSHLFEIPLHIHPAISIENTAPSLFTLTPTDGRSVQLKIDSQLSPEIILGQESPILGWYSPAFYEKEPCPVVYAQMTSARPFTLETEISVIL